MIITAFLLLTLPLLAAPSPDALPVAGRITDTTGAVVASATVTAYAKGQSNIAASAQSGPDGRFALQLLPGDYVVHVNGRGSLETTETVSVSPRNAGPYDFVLRMASVREEITVHAPSGYRAGAISSAMKTDTVLREVPQSISVVTAERMQDQLMTGIGDAIRYVPGVTLHQGENNRDQIVMRGNSSSADFFLDGVRDDVQYYRDLYNLDRVEVLKGPNALIFGRGGAGGVINRVSKQAGFLPIREVEVSAGVFDQKRFAADFSQPVNDTVAVRLNALNEHSGSFRDDVSLQRWGLAPSVAFLAGKTMVTLGYEHFHDARVADRGITSYQGRPADVPIETYYGNPKDSHVRADVDLASASIQHQAGRLTIRNRTLFGAYDRAYQNYVPGAVSRDKSTVTLTAYNNATERRNAFNQFDVIGSFDTGRVRHTVVTGFELGRQATSNFRNTGYFNNASTSIGVPYARPSTLVPVTFRQSATDASNHVTARIAAAYAQEQLEISRHLKVIGGIRLDHFNLDYQNRRNGARLGRTDDMLSPRLAVIVSPSSALSMYASRSVSHLPGSGDQFSSLTSITQQLEPERFINSEIGLKWDAPAGFSVATALYRLDRTNTRATDPNDPTRIVQTGSQRTKGAEITVDGNITPSWSISGGYAHQDAFVSRATVSARAGAKVGQVPRQTFSLWSRYSPASVFGVAIGVVHRASMFATIDNSVTLPSYTEVDAAAYFTLRPSLHLQVNVENLFDTVYYANADSNTNISPGAPRALRLALVTRF